MKSIALATAGLAATTLLSAPVFAEKVPVSDTELSAVYGAANNSAFVGAIENSTVSATNASGNIQVGHFQWTDDHTADASINKGANNQSGDYSMVQQNAIVMANALAWGTVAQSVTMNTASVAGSQRTESWAVMFIGGF